MKGFRPDDERSVYTGIQTVSAIWKLWVSSLFFFFFLLFFANSYRIFGRPWASRNKYLQRCLEVPGRITIVDHNIHMARVMVDKESHLSEMVTEYLVPKSLRPLDISAPRHLDPKTI